jgi:predicted glycosyltransferase
MHQNRMLPEAIYEKRILFCILDWGLGHATRSSVLIDRLLNQENKITIVCSQSSLGFLKQKFSALSIICIEGYSIKYYKGIPVWLSVVIQLRKIQAQIKIEQQFLQKETLKNAYDIIISDSRYGCYHNEIPSVFISHQLQLKVPFFESFTNKRYQKYLLPFHSIWVPDFENDNNLSGDLSHSILKLGTNTKNKLAYIGPLPRFSFETKSEKEIDLLFILSGPEPLRTLFEAEIINYSMTSKKKITIVRGTSKNSATEFESHVKHLDMHDLLGENELKNLIENANAIVCRSGYSSIMDYYQLPIIKYIYATPGQTEQEYLASSLNHRFGFKKINNLKDLD